ncbi:hypothetical protein L227DRAFT_437480 [Lentinus tigrinus ALCF2SS1-6]|uniref:Uncharacterized protein n=1 Tax=Lentinus tigrinus ALCF2SS1-6 TaxID=1328759 RepID=A0A5C2SHT7_9APHY|nr:hypothetical protein L227DRAFT_437480 [Lentinus tigrinus ALCF2SS1-6]
MAILPRSAQGLSEHQPAASASSSQQGSESGQANNLLTDPQVKGEAPEAAASPQATGATGVSRIRPGNPRSLEMVEPTSIAEFNGCVRAPARIRLRARGEGAEGRGVLGNREHQEIASDQGGFSNGRRFLVVAMSDSEGDWRLNLVVCGIVTPRFPMACAQSLRGRGGSKASGISTRGGSLGMLGSRTRPGGVHWIMAWTDAIEGARLDQRIRGS